MQVIDKRFIDESDWTVGDIIGFGKHNVKENYGMIISLDFSNSVDLAVLKSDDLQQGYTGFNTYTSILELQDHLKSLFPFVENMGKDAWGKMVSSHKDAHKKFDFGDILMCKYKETDKDFDLLKISPSPSGKYTINILHEQTGEENRFFKQEFKSADQLVDFLRNLYKIVEKVPAYVVLGVLGNDKNNQY